MVSGPVSEGDRIWTPGVLRNLVTNGDFRLGEHAEGYVKNAWCAGGSSLHVPGWESFAEFGRGGLNSISELNDDGWSIGPIDVLNSMRNFINTLPKIPCIVERGDEEDG